jgi:hypothetical protein
MKKQQRHFSKVEEYRERFEKLPTEKIIGLFSDTLIKEAAIAYRESLQERGAWDDAFVSHVKDDATPTI